MFLLILLAQDGDERALCSAYRSALDLAIRPVLIDATPRETMVIRSLALCCISTGIYGFDNEEAAVCALRTTREWLDDPAHAEAIDAIVFCTFLDRDREIYERLMPTFFPVIAGASAGGRTQSAAATQPAREVVSPRSPQLQRRRDEMETTTGETKSEPTQQAPRASPPVTRSYASVIDLSNEAAPPVPSPAALDCDSPNPSATQAARVALPTSPKEGKKSTRIHHGDASPLTDATSPMWPPMGVIHPLSSVSSLDLLPPPQPPSVTQLGLAQPAPTHGARVSYAAAVSRSTGAASTSAFLPQPPSAASAVPTPQLLHLQAPLFKKRKSIEPAPAAASEEKRLHSATGAVTRDRGGVAAPRSHPANTAPHAIQPHEPLRCPKQPHRGHSQRGGAAGTQQQRRQAIRSSVNTTEVRVKASSVRTEKSQRASEQQGARSRR